MLSRLSLQPLFVPPKPAEVESGGEDVLTLPTENRILTLYAGDGVTFPNVNTAGNGQPVDSWIDIANGRNPANTGSNRPTFRKNVAALNNRSALEFVRANSQSLYHNYGGVNGIITPLPNWTIYIVLTVSGTTLALDPFSEGYSSGDGSFLIVRANDGTAGLIAGLVRDYNFTGSTVKPTTGNINNGAAHLITYSRFGAGSYRIRIDGGAHEAAITNGTTNTVNTSLNQFAIGSLRRTTPANYFNGHIGLVAAYSTVHDPALEAAIMAHYGIV